MKIFQAEDSGQEIKFNMRLGTIYILITYLLNFNDLPFKGWKCIASCVFNFNLMKHDIPIYHTHLKQRNVSYI